eukprot:CAMPEP_0116118790 /NCGR_PEP_ID=MMETSP0329-20121206/2295_1 /TAXON_ID=697910 /ORGANISM="Pseudo-nitzschia arenysensis, Strain B593" /LENGTH=433 /DNA_ID=CAMNT_0003612447 /DNA_START=228 /DNA_END=1530 /DNA_ORIENTATION=+
MARQTRPAADRGSKKFPSILEYIRRVGVGRQGKETRRKRHPHGKKKKKRNNNNSEQHYQQRQDNDTMSREEERLFLGNGRVARRSGVGTSATNNRQQRSISPIVPPAPPPPFGEGQSFRTESDNDSGEKERKIRVLPAKVLGRVTPSDENNDDENLFPRSSSGLPEVAIVDRSNVGKSTLLNALLYSGKAIEKEESEAFVRRRNRRLRSKVVTSQTAKLPKGIKAKTSSKPGETRSIDFYQLSAEIEASGNKKKSSLLLVDLPGYGFAFGPKKERKQMEDSEEAALPDYLFPWQSLIETYVTNRPRSSLKRVLLLIDARHGMKQADSQFLEGLQRALIQKQRNVAATKSSDPQQHPRVPTELPPLQIVLTKCDLVSQVDLARRVVQVREQLSDCLVRQPKMLPEMLVSAQIEGQGGVLELQKELASLCSADFQ